MFPALRIKKAQRELNGGGFQERSVVATWPTISLVSSLQSLRPARFYQLLQFHRPTYIGGGHRGPTRKQRFGNKRQSWKRQFRHQ